MNIWGSYINLLGKLKFFSRIGSIVWSFLPLPAYALLMTNIVSQISSNPSTSAQKTSFSAALNALIISTQVLMMILLFMIPQAIYSLKDCIGQEDSLSGKINNIKNLHNNLFQVLCFNN